jgi:hypothetical protein
MAALNPPEEGDTIKAEPIKTLEDIKAIKRLLADKPCDLCVFPLGINTNLSTSDLLNITLVTVCNLTGNHGSHTLPTPAANRKRPKKRTCLSYGVIAS